MGEVVRFPGPQGENNERASLDIIKVTELLETLTLLFKNQPGLQNNIPSRVEYLASTSDNKLVTIINTSTKSEWQQRPAYYAAAVERLRKTGII